jgi:acetyltransferase-like isoleucine patch superfamily enzyme
MDQGLTNKGIEVGDDVWFGTGVRVLDGVKIVSGCVVGAGCVVSRSLEVPGVYVGVPARLIRRR